MFIQCSFSLEELNFIFKVKLNEESLSILKKEKIKIKKYGQAKKQETVEDIYESELIGLAYAEVTEDFMKNEVTRWTLFLQHLGLEIYDLKKVSLKERLIELEKLTQENKDLIETI